MTGIYILQIIGMPRSKNSPPIARQPPTTSQPQIVEVKKNPFGQIVKEGVGFGIGSAIGHRIIESIFSSRGIDIKENIKSDNKLPIREFENCMIENYNDYDTCKKHLETMK
jgi:hypothetical protein